MSIKDRIVYDEPSCDGTSLPPEAVAFKRRAHILDATVREIARNGYADASVAAIVDRAGLPRHAFYAHYKSKRDAVISAYDLAAAFAIPRILDAFRGEPTWASGARTALATYLAILDCDHAWSLTCLREVAAAGPAGIAAQDAIREPLVEALKASTPVPMAVDMSSLLAAVDAVVVDALRRQHGVLLHGQRAELIEILLAPFAGPTGHDPASWLPDRPVVCKPAALSDSVVENIDRPEGERLVALLVRDAATRRDGPALWQILSALRRRREAGLRVSRAIEREALDGLEDAWSFGLFPQSDA